MPKSTQPVRPRHIIGAPVGTSMPKPSHPVSPRKAIASYQKLGVPGSVLAIGSKARPTAESTAPVPVLAQTSRTFQKASGPAIAPPLRAAPQEPGPTSIVVEAVARNGKETLLSFASTATFGDMGESIRTAFQIPRSKQELTFKGIPLVFGASAPLREVFEHSELAHVIVDRIAEVPKAIKPESKRHSGDSKRTVVGAALRPRVSQPSVCAKADLKLNGRQPEQASSSSSTLFPSSGPPKRSSIPQMARYTNKA